MFPEFCFHLTIPGIAHNPVLVNRYRCAGATTSRLSHRVTGSTGSECPAPVPVPGTGQYRPVMSFVLVPLTDWPTCPGRLLLEFGQRAQPQQERPAGRLAAC
jgi:hypothetical protein